MQEWQRQTLPRHLELPPGISQVECFLSPAQNSHDLLLTTAAAAAATAAATTTAATTTTTRTEHALDQAASQLELRLTNPEGFVWDPEGFTLSVSF